MDKNSVIVKSSRHIVLMAMMAATLIAGKFALSFVPNIEVVTSLIIIYAFVFGWETIPAVLVFCTVDIIIYPPSLDVIISYYIYWDLLAIIVALIKSLKITAFYVYLIIGLVMTMFFGFITALMMSLVFGVPFLPAFFAGFPFYALQLVSTLVFMLAGFMPLTKALTKLRTKYYA